jgi:DNA-binding CsgD family transcriptional regulator
MIALPPLLHEIIPHGWTRMALLEPDATIRSPYAEHPAAGAIYRERLSLFMDDPSALMSLWVPTFRACGIGWTLHRQGRSYLESGYYREVEAPLDSCWMLDSMIGYAGRTIAMVNLTRPRSARHFTVEHVQQLDRLRPWLAHALRPNVLGAASAGDDAPVGAARAPVRSGQIILTSGEVIAFQTGGTETLLRLLADERGDYTRPAPLRDKIPSPIRMLIRRIIGATGGTSNTPPRTQISTSHGVIALEAKWLVPAGAIPVDIAKDPKSCLIAVTVELREHAIAHAARILRESGATPAQLRVGIQLAMGKTKPVIATELGIQRSTVEGLTKKLYQTLDVHNSAELGTKIWLGERRSESRQSRARDLATGATLRPYRVG